MSGKEERVKQLERVSVLNMGMFLKRVGSVSRKIFGTKKNHHLCKTSEKRVWNIMSYGKKRCVRSFIAICMVIMLCIGMIPIQQVHAEETQQVYAGLLAPIEGPDASAEKIYTPEDLNNIRNNMYGSYVLMNDIDMSSYGDWNPIGKTVSEAFHGKLDGQGHIIKGLTVKLSITSGSLGMPYHVAGLFGVCSGAAIKNLVLQDIDIAISNSSGYAYSSSIDDRNIYAGGAAGYLINDAVIYNCSVSGKVTAATSQEALEAFCGGAVGYASEAVVSYVDNSCVIKSESSNSISSADSHAGGIAGLFNGVGYLDHCRNIGTINSKTADYGHAYAGGLVGKTVTENGKLEISDCFNQGQVTAASGNTFSNNAYAGGIAGVFTGSINRVYNNGVVQANVTALIPEKAYAGGICAELSETAVVENSVQLQKQIAASSEGETKCYCIASGNGSKFKNVAIEGVAAGVTKDADLVKTEEELSVSEVYEKVLGWDFLETWELAEEEKLPQLKRVNTEDTAYQQEYIQQHLEFLDGKTYNRLLEEERWAQIYWSEENNFQSNMAGALYDGIDAIVDGSFKELFADENPYKVILADYISDQGVQTAVAECAKLEVPFELEKIYKKTKSFLQENWVDSWGTLSDEDLFFMFHYKDRPSEEWVNSDFPEHLDEIVASTRNSGKGFETVLGISSEVLDKLLEAKDTVNNVIEYYNELVNYAAEIEAYTKTSEEFKKVLERMADNVSDSDAEKKKKLSEAISSYIIFNNEENVKARIFCEFELNRQEEQFKGFIADTLEKNVDGWIKETFSDAAISKLETIKKAAKVGWKISEYITKNGELQDCRNMLRANADFETVMYDTLKEIEAEFCNSPTIENAKLFDSAFRFWKETEIYSMDVCMTYMDTYQTAWLPAIRNGSNTFMNSAIEQVIFNKLYFYNVYCHGTVYNLGGRIVKIACPTDVTVYNAQNEEVAVITENEIVKDEVGVSVFTTNGIKWIGLPTGQEYLIKITATDNGVMDYYVSEYMENEGIERTLLCENVSLQKGCSYESTIGVEISNDMSGYALWDMSVQNMVPYQVIEVQNRVAITAVVMDKKPEKLAVGEVIKLSAAVLPDNASVKKVAWYSSDASIAAIDEDGTLHALAPGEVMITVYSIEGGFADTCTVNITEKENGEGGITDSGETDDIIDGGSPQEKPEEPPENRNDGNTADNGNEEEKTEGDAGNNSGNDEIGEGSVGGEELGLPAKGTQFSDSSLNAVFCVQKEGISVEYVRPLNKKVKSVKIPSSVKKNGITYKVTGIRAKAFKNNRKIQKVIIGGNVTQIGNSAFQGCTALKNITIGKAVKSIGNSAFANCTAIKKITLPANVRKIGAKAFYNCKSITKLEIQSTKLKESNIGTKAFSKVGSKNYGKLLVKVPKKKLALYKKILRKKGLNTKVKIEKK